MQASGLLSIPNVPYPHASALHSTDKNFKLSTVNFLSGSAPEHTTISKNERAWFVNGAEVKRVVHHKHLGRTFDSKLSFSFHVNDIISKVRNIIGTIRFLSSYLPLKTLD